MKFYLLLTLIMTSVIQTWASDSISYSGRLVNANGSPVTGYVNLTFELAHTDQLGVILCSKEIDGVGLSNGVFHVKLSFSNCNLTNLLSSTGPSQTISIRVIDRTQEPDKIYSFQTINSVPVSVVSQVSKQVDQMGAVTGQVLTWNGTKWAPASEVGTGNGTVTSLGTGSGLEGGTITSAGTISIATSGVEGFHLKDGTITDSDISGSAEIQQSKIQNLVADLAAKQNSVAAGTIAQYWRGDKSWQDMDQSVRNALLLGYSTGTATPLSPTDNVMEALGKLEGQIIANDTAFDNAGQWERFGSIIYYNTGNVGVGTSTPYEKLDVAGNIALSGKIRLKDSGSNYVELKSPTTIAGTVTFTLPGFLGSNGQVLATDALGNLTWLTPSTTSSNIVDGSIVDADISSSANIAQSKIANLTIDLSSKEPTLIAGTTAQYLRGDKSWQTLNTDAVVEGTKLYFTESKVLGTDLVGLSAIPGNITDSDSILSAIGKLAGNQSNYVLKAGDSMAGNLLMGGNYVTGLGSPLLDSDAATKLYVDTELSNKTYWTKTVNDLTYISGNVGVGTTTPLNKLDVVGDIGLSGKIRIKSDTANYIELKAPTGLGSTQTYTLPLTTGTSGYALTTNGAGALTWSAVATNSTSIGGDLVGTISNAQIVAGTIVNADIADATINYGKLNLIDGDIPQAKVNGLATTLGGKEPNITAGTTSQYWRGDKTWQSLSTTVVSEGTNLYFLDSRVRDALMSGYVTGAATPLSAADTLLEALAKLEGQILANKAAFDSTGQWNKNGSSIYYNGGNVGIGTTAPSNKLSIGASLGTGYALTANSESSPYGMIIQTSEATASGNAALWVRMTPDSGSTTNTLFRVQNNGNVGIGITTPGAILDIASTTSGLLIPRMTTVQRDAIVTPTGMQVYNTTTNKINFHNGTTWQEIGTAGDGVTSITAGTGLTGGTITSTGTIAVDVGTTAGRIVQLDGFARLPVVDGSLLTNLSPANLGSVVPITKGGTGLSAGGAANTLLGMDAAGTAMEYKGMSAASPLSLTHGAGTVALDLGTVPITKGGTGLSSLTGNRLYTSNSLGTALQTFTCSLTEVLSFNGLGEPICSSLSSIAGFVNNGNSFGANAVLGTNDAYSLSFETNGTTVMTILTSGNVGIGTTTPIQKLEVVGDIISNQDYLTSTTFTDGWAVGDWKEIVQANPASAAGSSHYEVHISSTRNSWVDASTYIVGGAHAASDIWREAVQTYETLYGSATKCFTVDFNGSSRIFRIRALKASASCGVTGANIPVTFKIRSIGHNNSWTPLATSGTVGTVTGFQSQGASWNLYTGDPRLNAGNLAIHVNSSANVGIGTTLPNSKLEVRSSVAGALTNFTQNVVNAGILIDSDTVNATHNSGLFWRSSNNNPTKPKAGIWMYQEDGPGSWLMFGTSNSYVTGITNTAMSINPSGSVGIGTTAPAYKLDVRGGNVNSEGAITNVSDRRLKENILPLDSTLEKILQLESVSYVWKDRSFDPSKQVGFIAQDVEKVFPEVVKTDSKGFKAMSYSQLISPVVKAIQELYTKWSDDHDEIEKLKSENAVLKAQNEEILKRLDRLENERKPASNTK